MPVRVSKRPGWMAAVLASAVCALLLGCPQAQTPNVPDETTDSGSSGGGGGSQTDDTPDRPVQQPDLDDGDTTTSSGGNSGLPSGPVGEAPGGADDGDQGGGSAVNNIALQIQEPAVPKFVRLGEEVTVSFEFIDPTGAGNRLDLVYDTDADGDGAPDGAIGQLRAAIDPSDDNPTKVDTTTLEDELVDAFGRFFFGVRVTAIDGSVKTALTQVVITIDNLAPSANWISPTEGAILSRTSSVSVQFSTSDNSPHTVTLKLDPDLDPGNGNEFELAEVDYAKGAEVRSLNNLSLAAVPAGAYSYLLEVTDNVGDPAYLYAPNNTSAPTQQPAVALATTNRLIGEFDLNQLTNSNQGGILQGFNFNDLGGSAVAGVDDLNGDGLSELVAVSRFGKPYGVGPSGIGYGEAYLIFGSQGRIRGQQPLNATGDGNLLGIVFPGIRVPTQVPWTEGMSDVTVVRDMDGDDLPELVFSFPRAESVSMAVETPVINPVLPDIASLGLFEWDARLELLDADPDVTDPMVWWRNTAQFARGGIVIVSSHNVMTKFPTLRNRKGDRVVDLQETGQVFSHNASDEWPREPYLLSSFSFNQFIDCDGDPMNGAEKEFATAVVLWDAVFRHQGPGGFMNDWTVPGLELFRRDGMGAIIGTGSRPPLAPFEPFPYTLNGIFGRFYANMEMNPCDTDCIIDLQWFDWSFAAPNFAVADTVVDSWLIPSTPANPVVHPVTGENLFVYEPNFPGFGDENPTSVWTGFVARGGTNAFIDDETVGCRILGQEVNDRFGTTVSSDGTWLYIAAPRRTAKRAGDNVATLPTAERSASGVVYQLRTDARPGLNQPSVSQLWIEPGTRTNAAGVTEAIRWPFIDAEFPDRQDHTMPTPHQYIIEEVGSIRGDDRDGEDLDADGLTGFEAGAPEATAANAERQNVTAGIVATDGGPSAEPECGGSHTTVGGENLSGVTRFPSYRPASTGQAAYHMDSTPQIVGPHADSQISFVRAVGDVNDDGVNDFAIGSRNVRSNVATGTGVEVGALFVVFGRPTGVEGDILLERMALPLEDPQRIEGVLIRGANAGERLARVIDSAGDFNGDGVNDIVIGNESADNGEAENAGEVLLLFGSSTLTGSPAGGWTIAQMLEDEGDRIIRFRGEAGEDMAGANVAGAGDVDGDGKDDILIAAPNAREGKGVVYLVYGSDKLENDVALVDVGSVKLPGVKFVGRKINDRLGGGEITYGGAGSTLNVFLQPDANRTTTVTSRGISQLGDIDGDGRGDYAITSMLADPNGKTNAGEVYILYGRGD